MLPKNNVWSRYKIKSIHAMEIQVLNLPVVLISYIFWHLIYFIITTSLLLANYSWCSQQLKSSDIRVEVKYLLTRGFFMFVNNRIWTSD